VLLEQILSSFDHRIISGNPDKVEILNGITCDLLSEVMAISGKAEIWITVQSHSNIVAVAVITGIKCIILSNGREFSEDTLKKAAEEKIILISTKKGAFEVSGKIYEMLQR